MVLLNITNARSRAMRSQPDGIETTEARVIHAQGIAAPEATPLAKDLKPLAPPPPGKKSVHGQSASLP